MDPVTTGGWDAQGNPVSPPPAAPPAPQGWDAQGNPISSARTAPAAIAPPAPPRPAQDLITARFGPEGGEGGYKMHDFAGTPHTVGYSKVHQALDNGFLFSDKQNLQQYARDHAADPLDESRVDQWIDKHPIITGPLQGVIGGYRSLLRTGTAFDRPPTTRGETEAQLFAATPNRTPQESAGAGTEGLGEFFTGEQLLGMLGRTGMVMSAAEKLKTVTGLAQLIEKVPMVGKLLKVGESAAKQGTVSAGQTYVNTGGDTGAAMTAGALGAAAAPIAQVAGATLPAAGTLIKAAVKGPGEATAAAGTDAATAAARQAQAVQNVTAADQEAAALRATAEENAARSRAAAEQHEAGLRATAQQTAAESKAAAEQHETAMQNLAARKAGLSKTTAEEHAANLRATAERNVAEAQAAAESQAAAARTAEQERTAASRAAYAEHARAAIRPTLEETNVARRNVPQQEVMMNQPGGAPAAPTGRMAARTAPAQINIDHVLNQTHDFTGAADHLTAINDDAYNQFDAATGGRFRQLNAQVAEAQNAMRKGEQGAAGLYKQKLAEMDNLMDSTRGEITPEMKDAAKAGFRQSYMLRDFGNLWDRNLGGVPGASQASQIERGINGKGLMTDLQRAVKLYGRPQIEEALGPGRLSNLEEIAQQNITGKQRQAFNTGLRTVAQELARLEAAHPAPATTTVAQELANLRTQTTAPRVTTAAQELARLRAQQPGPQVTTAAQELARLKAQTGPAPAKVAREVARLEAEAAKAAPPAPAKAEFPAWGKRSLAFTVGAGLGHVTGVGGFTGGVAGEAAYETTRFVLNAIKTNPKIGQNFLFALQSGATAERYGPFIASMIQQATTQSSRQQQQREQEQQR